MKDKVYIDVRGTYPILFINLKAYELTGKDRNITLKEALESLG